MTETKVAAPKKQVVVMLSCDLPPYNLINTPSFQEGLPRDTEEALRIWGCEFIQSCGILLKCPQVVMASAQILFQRYYCRKSFLKNRVDHYAMACLFLAAKVEESPRAARDVVNVSRHVMARDGEPSDPLDSYGEEYLALKKELVTAERRVLKELGFCVHVNHPHKLIISYIKMLGLDEVEELAQLSWNYMNDGLRTNVFLRFKAEVIACACIHLALLKLQVSMPPDWWLIFDATLDGLREIGATILGLYQRDKLILDDLLDDISRLTRSAATPAMTPYIVPQSTVRVRSPSIQATRKDDDGGKRKRKHKEKQASRSPSPYQRRPILSTSPSPPPPAKPRKDKHADKQRKRTPSPQYRKRSPSPSQHRKRSSSPSQHRKRSPSPSQYRKRSPSPSHRRSPSPPARYKQHASPSRRRSNSPYQQRRASNDNAHRRGQPQAHRDQQKHSQHHDNHSQHRGKSDSRNQRR